MKKTLATAVFLTILIATVTGVKRKSKKIGPQIGRPLRRPHPQKTTPSSRIRNSTVRHVMPQIKAFSGDDAPRPVGQDSGMTLSKLIPVEDCGQKIFLDDWEAALLYSRNDLHSYDCEQRFKAMNPEADLHVECPDFRLKFNCFFESLEIEVDGNTDIYCSRDTVPTSQGKEVTFKYQRKLSWFGGYVCTVSAVPLKIPQNNCSRCGITVSMGRSIPFNIERIVGGENAVQNEFPSMALLYIWDTYGYSSLCGGNLVSNRIIVTAAHCLDFEISKIEVALGKVERMNYEELGSRWYNTVHHHQHPDYNPYTVTNDIAVIILNEDVPYTSSIRPLCLPKEHYSLGGVTVTATGWGLDDFYNGDTMNILQKVDLTTYTNEACQEAWNEYFRSNTYALLPSQVCASATDKDTCSGDSGGPLMIKVDNQWVLVGITSYGYECAVNGVPGVYTRVSLFTNWINQFIEEGYCT